MANLPILVAPHPILSQKAQFVEHIDNRVRLLLSDMAQTMYEASGVGLAAPQVGVSDRIVVIDVTEDATCLYKMVNPEIIWVSDHDNLYQEGCFSLPAHYADVVRPAEVKVRYLDHNGKQHELHADGLLATCIQHEIDHLDGILFIDHISALKRNMILRKLLKNQKFQD